MYAVLGIQLTDENYCEGDADWLCVPLSPSMVRATLERAQMAKFGRSYDGSFNHTAFTDHSVTLFGNGSRRYKPGELVDRLNPSKVARCDYSVVRLGRAIRVRPEDLRRYIEKQVTAQLQ